jgi:hypothetical protein
MALTGLGFIVVFCNPLLAARDDSVLDLAGARQPREGLLADGVPVDQIDARDLHRDVYTTGARDQVQRQVQKRSATTSHYQALALTSYHQRLLFAYLDTGKARPHILAPGPVCGGLQVIEQASLGKQHGARAGSRQCRALRKARFEPGDLFRIVGCQHRAGFQVHFGNTDHRIRRAGIKTQVRGNGNAIANRKRAAIPTHQQRAQQCGPRRTPGNQVPVAAGALEQVEHTVDHRGCGLGQH